MESGIGLVVNEIFHILDLFSQCMKVYAKRIMYAFFLVTVNL